MPSLELILGPMFAGKTTELFRRVRKYTAAGRNCLIVRYASDTRYSEEHASTHDREMLRASGAGTLSEIVELAKGYDVVGIDEGQFYPDLVEVVQHQLLGQGKDVIIAALDGTYERKPFGHVLELVPLADSVTKLNAVCSFCHAAAPFTRRITASTQLVDIGGSDKYLASCRACHALPLEQLRVPIQRHGETLLQLAELRVK